MPRKKNYEISEHRAAPVIATPLAHEPPRTNADDAFIDMAVLLGSTARFAGKERTIDLRNWLGRGIDDWVCAAGFCLKAMLLSGTRTTASVSSYKADLRQLLEYLIGSAQNPTAPRVQTPAALSPLHVQHFIGWLKKRAHAEGWRSSSIRSAYSRVKAILVEMFSQGFITGDPSRFFPRAAVTWRTEASHQSSLSEAEQERLAKAIKSDLIAFHHNRQKLSQRAVQGLRLLLVAHRQGLNPTPLLEMQRDALAPGLLPGTIRIRTVKHRNRKVHSSVGRDALGPQAAPQPSEQDLFFDLSEGAVLQQAIASTRDLVREAPTALKQRIWLYRAEASSGAVKRGSVTALTRDSLAETIDGVIRRHTLLGDDGVPLRVNLSRLRKSRFDRALSAADGDMAITANLMGNTPRVAGTHYPSMNDARKAEAAGFMNDDYTALMRGEGQSRAGAEIRLVRVRPFKAGKDGASALPTPTPVSGCKDSLHGEHAPHDGLSHCDRYVMCLFCASFAIVGTVDGLWRLFSFQVFAKAELDYLDEALGPERTGDQELEELRDRYRMAIPYIDDFTRRQFARSRVAQARARTAAGLHPFWQHQMTMSRRARGRMQVPVPRAEGSGGDAGRGDRSGT